jgi:electron transport complex protein RnfG
MNKNDILQPAPPDNFKMFRAMVGIGILCAFLIVLTYENTFSIIKQNKTEALEKAVFNVLPGATKKVNYIYSGNGFEPAGGDAQKVPTVYAGFNENNDLIGIAIEASGQGFQDVLNILYGYSPHQQAVIGFYVLESRETPGLGDKIEKDENFLANFIALDVSLDASLEKLSNPVDPVKNGSKENPWEVDCITGATITSKAVGNIINNSSQYWAPKIFKNKDQFLKN